MTVTRNHLMIAIVLLALAFVCQYLRSSPQNQVQEQRKPANECPFSQAEIEKSVELMRKCTEAGLIVRETIETHEGETAVFLW